MGSRAGDNSAVGQLHAASTFPAVAGVPDPVSLPSAQQTDNSLPDQAYACAARMPHPMAGPFRTSTSRLRSFKGKLTHQTKMLCHKYLQKKTRLKKPAYGMNDAPWKWWNKLDAAVKNMGLCPAKAGRCTYVSYSDVKNQRRQIWLTRLMRVQTRRLSVTPHLFWVRTQAPRCVTISSISL